MHSTKHRCDQRTRPLVLACVFGAWLSLACTALAQQDGVDSQTPPPAPARQDAQAEQQRTEPPTDDAPATVGEPRTDKEPSTEVDKAVAPGRTDVDAEPPATEAQPPAIQVEPVDTTETARKDPTSYYNLWVLLPAIIAILLAILSRQVIPALLVGILVGSYMMVPCLATSDAFAEAHSIIAGFRLAAERYILGAVTDPANHYGHISIIVFTLVIGFMIGVIGRNGGTEGMVKLVAGKTSSPRRVGLTAWFAGLVVFFDDYSNTMIVGPTMQSVFDRVRLSRAKLAYIVDSTAAPVASIALIGTWVGAEIGFIQQGLDAVTESGAPAFLIDDQGNVLSGWVAFVQSIPYRFYPILALLLVFLVAFTRRDFGPMKRSERKVLSRIEPDPVSPEPGTEEKPQTPPRWWLGVIPILVLVAGTVVVLGFTGYQGVGGEEYMRQPHPWYRQAADIAGQGDAYLSIYYGALLSAFVAIILTMLARACSIGDAVDAGLGGMTRMFPAMVILVLAWALSAILTDLQLGNVVAGHLKAQNFPAQWLPLGVFVSAAVISFATGTSWGTMAILCPMTVDIGVRLIAGIEQPEALHLFYASVGSVLAGAVFGDHCSPISDTTVLSSIASGCRHEEHVWTQIPYALLAAIASMGLGDVLCSVYKQPWYFGLGAGAIFLVVVLLIFGRQAQPSLELADA